MNIIYIICFKCFGYNFLFKNFYLINKIFYTSRVLLSNKLKLVVNLFHMFRINRYQFSTLVELAESTCFSDFTGIPIIPDANSSFCSFVPICTVNKISVAHILNVFAFSLCAEYNILIIPSYVMKSCFLYV